MTCVIEQLAESLPQPQRGLTEPWGQFLRNVRDDRGDVVFSTQHSDMAVLQIIVPIPRRDIHDMRTAVDLTRWWPNALKIVTGFIERYDPDALGSQANRPAETDDGPAALWLDIILPFPRHLLHTQSAGEMAAEMLPLIDESLAMAVRQYQVAARLAN